MSKVDLKRPGYKPHSHCHFCGTLLEDGNADDGGIRCAECSQVNYRNPTPVAALIIPTSSSGNRIMVVRRNIEPGYGELALPAGYLLFGETWEQAGAREAYEETGCAIRKNIIEWPKHFLTESTPDGAHIIIVGTARAFYLGNWRPNREVQEVLEYHSAMEEKLCFPIHQKAVDAYFAKIGIED